MRYPPLLLLAAIVAAGISCKPAKDAQPTLAGGHSRSTPSSQTSAAPTTAPTTAPATQPDATAAAFEKELLQFIAASRPVVSVARAAGVAVDPSPDGFDALCEAMKDNDALKNAIATSGISFTVWKSVGARAWAAWRIAQGDYNTEEPLRKNAKRLADARAQIALAEAVLKGGTRVLPPEERAQRVAGAKDAAVNARDRAEMWGQKAADLRERLAGAGGAGRGPAPGQALPPIDGIPREGGFVLPGGDRLALSQELAAAERNERQAREDAIRFEESAQHPEQASNDAEKMELLRAARESMKKANAEVLTLQEEARVFQARLSEDRQSNTGRWKVPASDVSLLRKHLAEFNAAWDLTVDGWPK